MKRPFVKMHGLGNDFVIIDEWDRPFSPTREQLRWIADRRRGIGCDQIVVVGPGRDTAAAYRVFNADGEPAGQCGNGARCVARLLHDQRRMGSTATVAGPSGPVEFVVDSGMVRVSMGPPCLEPHRVPFDGPTAPIAADVVIGNRAVEFRVVSMGNPHAVIEVDSVEAAPVQEIAPALQSDPRFAEGVNVGFMEIVDRSRLRLRVFERGVGETPACGSGACAAVVSGRLTDRLDSRVQVCLPGGPLEIEWSGAGSPVWMSGPAEYSFKGEFEE